MYMFLKNFTLQKMHILENKNFQKTFKKKKIIIQIFLYLEKTKHFLPKKM